MDGSDWWETTKRVEDRCFQVTHWIESDAPESVRHRYMWTQQQHAPDTHVRLYFNRKSGNGSFDPTVLELPWELVNTDAGMAYLCLHAP